MLAQRLAGVLLCERAVPGPEGDLDACGVCKSCEMSMLGTHPDYHAVRRELIKLHPDAEVRARKGIDLGIDVVRQFVIKDVATKPVLGRAKVFIVREAHTMTVAAQNALLKTLEEPPATTVLILISDSLDALLPTVRSRCQAVPFGLLPGDFIIERLRRVNEGITDEQARFCALHAGGSLGVAQRHYEDGLIEYDGRIGQVLAQVGTGSVPELAKRVIADAKELGDCYRRGDAEVSETEVQRRGLKALLSLIAMGLRRGLQVCVQAAGDDNGPYGSPAARLTPRSAAQAIRTTVAAERQLDLNANVQLCIEGLFIRLSRLMRV